MTGDPVLTNLQTESARHPAWFAAWLPTRSQILNALQLRIELLPDVEQAADAPAGSVHFASMRQGMGLIIAAALVAGLLPFLFGWIGAARVGAVLPLAQMGQVVEAIPGLQGLGVDTALAETAALIAGLEPSVFPGWLAAGVSAFGGWINWPLRWLAIWIVYGAAVLLLAKMLGATTTLQQFYTVTSFAFLPLILAGLGFIPCLGVAASVIGLLWAAAVYVVAVRAATKLSTGLAVVCTLAPAAVVALLSAAVAFFVALGIVMVLTG